MGLRGLKRVCTYVCVSLAVDCAFLYQGGRVVFSHVSVSSGRARMSVCFGPLSMPACQILWMFLDCGGPRAYFVFEQVNCEHLCRRPRMGCLCVRVLASARVCLGRQGCMPECALCVCLVYRVWCALGDCRSMNPCVCVCVPV